MIKVTSKATKFISSESNGNKVANLCAAKTERIKLPNYDVGSKSFHIGEFLSHQSGIEAMLNTRALESFQSLDADIYRSAFSSFRLFRTRLITISFLVSSFRTLDFFHMH